MENVIPVVLFAYTRPDYLKRILDCMKKDQIPLLFVFSDGPKSYENISDVEEVRRILHAIDWCEIHIIERDINFGLGKSILDGINYMFQIYKMVIVFEDDLIFVEGTYKYLCEALLHYKNDERVMSVTGWTHALVTPDDIDENPYFDGRVESLSWGTWDRAWKGMDSNALELMRKCQLMGKDIYRYGADFPEMALTEKKRNIWAIRFGFLHLLNNGLVLRPPHSLVEHEGYDISATNAPVKPLFYNDILLTCPKTPTLWPDSVENQQCHVLWQNLYGNKKIDDSMINKLRSVLRRLIKKIM